MGPSFGTAGVSEPDKHLGPDQNYFAPHVECCTGVRRRRGMMHRASSFYVIPWSAGLHVGRTESLHQIGNFNVQVASMARAKSP